MFIARNFGEDDDDVAMGPLVSLWWVDLARVRGRGGGNGPGGLFWLLGRNGGAGPILILLYFSISV